MFTQLNPPLPVNVEGRGKGYAFGLIDYGQEHNLIWVTAMDETGEIWCAPNPKVRVQNNWSMGRDAASGHTPHSDFGGHSPRTAPRNGSDVFDPSYLEAAE